MLAPSRRTGILAALALAALPLTAGRLTAESPRYRLAWCTYLGGLAWDQAREVLLLPDGSLVVGAQTCSTTLPTTPGAVQPRYAGDDPATGHPGVVGGDCYLAHLAADGKSLLAATYFGGSRQERNVYGLARDRRGNFVLASATRSPDAPTTPGGFQPRYGGGPADMLVTKITPDLKKLLWCTYVGGSGDDFPRGGLALDADDAVLLVGTTTSPDFPTTPGVFQPKLRGPRDSALVKLQPDGSGLVFGTYLGGSGEDDAVMGVRVDRAGTLHIAGHTKSTDFPGTERGPQPRSGGRSDAYLARLSPDARRLLSATYLGGSGDEFAEHRPWLADDGSLLVSGSTDSADFPITPGVVQRKRNGRGDGFLTRLAPDGRTFTFSTLLGGSGPENWLMPTVDSKGRIYLVGSTGSRDFPVTASALQRTFGGGAEDGALVVLSPDASRVLYTTYLGGSGADMIRSLTLGPKGEIYLVGSTSSDDFPVTAGALQGRHAGGGDAFVARLDPLD